LAPAQDKIAVHLLQISLKPLRTSGGAADSGIREMPVSPEFAHDTFRSRNTEFTGCLWFRMAELSSANGLRKSAFNAPDTQNGLRKFAPPQAILR